MSTDEIVPLGDEHPEHISAYGQETVVPEIGDAENIRLTRNVTVPSLTVHAPDPSVATGTGVIVCPGGSFTTLTHGTGSEIANRLTEHGLTVFVLRYRLLPTPREDEEFLGTWASNVNMDAIESQSRVAKDDAFRAVRVVRERASAWGVDPARVGMLGFSSGGLLTIGAATGRDAAGRPDFAAPIYAPVFDDYAVPADAPPLFVAFASDDEGMTVVPANLALYDAWRAADRSVEMHVYAEGGHAFVWRKRGLPCDTWMDRYLEWLRSQGFL
ncbi:alpha/beta hydrolase [Actinomadura vinacea]|uniref:Alpha/beta hydrolase n=1 Tax=Actinomadura vinacea TaxID=115336 RepID=A0ABN3JJM6_9ACTN